MNILNPTCKVNKDAVMNKKGFTMKKTSYGNCRTEVDDNIKENSSRREGLIELIKARKESVMVTSSNLKFMPINHDEQI